MTKEEKKLISKGIAYGLGYMAGKHKIKLTKKEVKKIIIDSFKSEKYIPEFIKWQLLWTGTQK